MPVKDTSLMALEQIRDKLEPDHWAVYSILAEIGPTHDRRILEALNQKEQVTLKPKRFKRRWEINQVTARRNELVNELGLVVDLGVYSGTWHGEKKTYHFWRIQGDEREPVGWKRLPDKPPAIELDDKCARCPYRRQAHLQQIRQQAEHPILARLRASEAGSILARYRRCRKGQIKGQMVLGFG